MKLIFVCDCGNQADLFATGETDENGRELLEVEDDDRLRLSFGESGLSFHCRFCKQMFLIDRQHQI